MKLKYDTPMRDRPAIRALLKTPGSKTEAEVIEIIQAAWIAGWKEGLLRAAREVEEQATRMYGGR